MDKIRRAKTPVKRQDHAKMWRVIEGAVVCAFKAHPDYLTDKGRKSAVQSVTKRVIGHIVGLATEVRKDSRLGGSCTSGAATIPGPSAVSCVDGEGEAKTPSRQQALADLQSATQRRDTRAISAARKRLVAATNDALRAELRV
ncbi:MAG: hypothetical protein CML68_13635 [Rhodobacteraceae bacterium]|nr:hypothetical protein [Paracoccaceae bacterium]